MPTENSSNTAQETVSTSQVDKGTRKKKSAKRSHLKVALQKSSKAVASGTSVSSLLRIPVPLSTATREQVSQYALLTSITGGTFEDVKFFAFSRRAASGESVGTPRPLFGNSALIRKASSHFDFGTSSASRMHLTPDTNHLVVLTKGFAESGIVDLDAPFPRNRPSAVEIDEYGYASDSDLEDDPDDDLGGKLEESMSSLSLGGGDGPKPEVQAQVGDNSARDSNDALSRPAERQRRDDEPSPERAPHGGRGEGFDFGSQSLSATWSNRLLDRHRISNVRAHQ